MWPVLQSSLKEEEEESHSELGWEIMWTELQACSLIVTDQLSSSPFMPALLLHCSLCSTYESLIPRNYPGWKTPGLWCIPSRHIVCFRFLIWKTVKSQSFSFILDIKALPVQLEFAWMTLHKLVHVNMYMQIHQIHANHWSPCILFAGVLYKYVLMSFFFASVSLLFWSGLPFKKDLWSQ